MRTRGTVSVLVGVVVAAAAFRAEPRAQAPPDAASVEFFESRIRPVLASKCYPCHSAAAAKPMGGLRLDTREAMLAGGDRGPAVVAAEPGASLLLRALSYSDSMLQMPPSGKLPDEIIADFAAWIRMGAPDPRVAESARPKGGIDLAEGRRFWSFQPIRDSAPPEVARGGWASTPVDRFVLARLEAKGIAPAPEADRATLLRRATFDVTGLPPTPQELEAFLADSSPHSWPKVVDRLLSSPRYGERWGRRWLDLVRFAETNGHEFDNEKLDAWRYRDYVIRALNADVPYTQLVREHVAGDLMADKRLSPDGAFHESPIATSFYWFGEVLNSATDSVKARADQVDNQIDVFGKTFLGLTVACARCHDHKFDPIPTTDYYALGGIFHSTEMSESVVDSPEHARRIAASHAKIDSINAQIRDLLRAVEEPKPASPAAEHGDVVFEDFEKPRYGSWTSSGEAFGQGPQFDAPPNQPLSGYRAEGMASSFGRGSDRLVGSLTSAKLRMPKLFLHARIAGSKEAARGDKSRLRLTVVADGHKSLHIVPDGSGAFRWKTLRLTKEIGRICTIEIVDRSRDGHIAVDAIVLSDSKEPPSPSPARDAAPAAPVRREDLASRLDVEVRRRVEALVAERQRIEDGIPESTFAMISRDDEPRDIRVHVRGNHLSLGDEVPRRFLQVLAGSDQASMRSGSGRLELADRVTSRDNPLLARVAVNRIWQGYFGHGLVRSGDNFGATGDRPTHPELLDFLAARFGESGWSMKAIHRLILLSSAYRMSSRPDAAAARLDPQNLLLHHMPVRRLEAEELRDAILAVAGTLDAGMFGPGVPPHISPYQDGRGKPEPGPLDGAGRRSVYIQVRRNFITPLFLAFDYPLPATTIGARGVSTVPSQALVMMNNDFVALQAGNWARRIAAAERDPARRVELAYRAAFARAPEERERGEARAFVRAQAERYASGADPEQQAWADLCHVLLNSAEFLYLR